MASRSHLAEGEVQPGSISLAGSPEGIFILKNEQLSTSQIVRLERQNGQSSSGKGKKAGQVQGVGTIMMPKVTAENAASGAAGQQRIYRAEGCKVVGETNTAHQHVGHLGDVQGVFEFKNCTVTGDGEQFLGGATGEAAVELARRFFRPRNNGKKA